MAVLTYEWLKNTGHLARSIQYAVKDRNEEDQLSAEGCMIDSVRENFEAVKRLHGQEKGIHGLNLIQSWSAQESEARSKEEFHALGKKLVESLFPGHQYIIKTHTDTGKFHNHITINPVHTETGERIRNKFFWKGTKTRFVSHIRSVNDQICLEAGLSVIKKDERTQAANIPFRAQKADRFHKNSWVVDLAQKADLARSLATSNDEFAGYMKAMGIDTRIEERNVSYLYPGKEKRKRGSKLGKQYDKAGLETAYKQNDERCAKNPELRRSLLQEFNDQKSIGVAAVATRDYSAHTKVARAGRKSRYASDLKTENSIIPLDEIRKAQRSIFEYCERNKIELSMNDKGEKVLKGREQVLVTEYEFINSKNKRRGSLIDFVAAHRNTSYLQAVAHINQNSRLLLLEQHQEKKLKYFPHFRFPKEEKADWLGAAKHLSNFIRALGGNPKIGEALARHEQVQVSRSGAIRFLAKELATSAREYAMGSENQWNEKRLGAGTHPFYVAPPRGRDLIIFFDPRSFIRNHGEHVFLEKKAAHGTLVLLNLDSEPVDRYLNEHRAVTSIQFVPSLNHKHLQAEVDFFGILQSRYKPFGIELKHEPLERKGRGTELDLSR